MREISSYDFVKPALYSTKHYGHWGEERQRNQRENAATRTGEMGKTNAIKEKQRNTAIHLLTQTDGKTDRQTGDESDKVADID